MSKAFLYASLKLWRWRKHRYQQRIRNGLGDTTVLRKKLANAVLMEKRRERQIIALDAARSVAPPLKTILSHSWGFHPPVHDGVDLICEPDAEIFALCDAMVIDVRAGGWWGKAPTGNVALGDGIIQLECLTDAGPFKQGMHFGYGHAEKAVVRVGQRVKAGQKLGHAGFANAWHVHFMANDGSTEKGVGDQDPWPFVAYAIARGED